MLTLYHSIARAYRREPSEVHRCTNCVDQIVQCCTTGDCLATCNPAIRLLSWLSSFAGPLLGMLVIIQGGCHEADDKDVPGLDLSSRSCLPLDLYFRRVHRG